MPVTDRDNGYAKMLADLDALGKVAVTVGIHEEEGAAPDGESELTIAEIAEANEFGIGVPARPFISAWADEKGAAFVTRMRDESAAAVAAKASPAQRLDALAQLGAGEVQQKIAAGIDPPNAPATVEKKTRGKGGATTPLIDTGIMRSSIRGKIGPKS